MRDTLGYILINIVSDGDALVVTDPVELTLGITILVGDTLSVKDLDFVEVADKDLEGVTLGLTVTLRVIDSEDVILELTDSVGLIEGL